jgi:antitoxin HigA-1
MKMHNPPHAGEVLKDMYIEPLELTVTKAAKALGVSRQTLSEIINSKAGVSIDMALRLSRAFKTTPEMWLNLQIQYELWHAPDKKLADVQCLVNTRSS